MTLLADKSVELVVVSTPNETHFDLAKQALEAGKHVVIDKPFAATSAEARALIDLARAKGLLVIPFHNRRWDGDFLTRQEAACERMPSDAWSPSSRTSTASAPLPRENTWKEAGNPANGMLFDLGPHLVDQALSLFGAPARHHRQRPRRPRPDRHRGCLRHHAALSWPRTAKDCSSTAAPATSRASTRRASLLHGTKGSFVKYGLDPQEPALVGGAKVPVMGSPEVWLEEKETAWGKLAVAPNPADPTTLIEKHIRTEPGDYRGFYANVRDAILGTAPLIVTPEAGYQVAKLLEMAREVLRQGLHAEGGV